MLFSKTDKLFEDAGKDPEEMEKLLGRLRRIRSGAFIVALIMLLILVVFSAWILIEAIAMLRSPSLKMSSSLEYFLRSGGISAHAVGIFVYVSAWLGVVNGMFDTDIKIKLLLTLRGMRACAGAER